MRAAIYCRLSMDKQGTGLGVERQEKECRALCASNGWEVLRVYVDNDISATTGKVRPGFERMMADDDYDVIVVWHTDRLVRLTRELLRLLDKKVNVHAVRAGHLDLSTPAGRAVATTITAWAQYEGEAKSDRQKAASLQRAQMGRGWWPVRPFGFEVDGSHREEEAAALRQAYSDILDGASVTSVCKRLNEQGYLTARGNAWRQASFRELLINPRNAGLRSYRGEVVGPAQWEGIVSEDTWQAMVTHLSDPARRIKRRTTGRGPNSLLTGILRCQKCGGHCSKASRTRGDGTKRPIYMCKREFCATADFDWANSFVTLELVRQVRRRRDLWPTQGMVDGDTKLEGLRQEKRDLTARRDAMADAYADGRINLERMLAVSSRVDERLAAVRQEMDHLVAALEVDDVMVDVEAMVEEFEDMDLGQRQSILRATFSEILLMPRRKGEKGPGRLELVPRVPLPTP